MAIRAIEQAKELREQGRRLGRAGLSERVLALLSEYKNPTYKEAIELAGRMKAIAMAARYDCYWDEKCTNGFHREISDIRFYQPNQQQRKDSGD